MSGAAHVISLVLLWTGVTVAVAAGIGLVLAPDHYARLHFITPITSVAGPLIGLSLAIPNGLTFNTGAILVTVGLLGLSGPALGAATARITAQREGRIQQEMPE